jgi:hypothetical protein
MRQETERKLDTCNRKGPQEKQIPSVLHYLHVRPQPRRPELNG